MKVRETSLKSIRAAVLRDRDRPLDIESLQMEAPRDNEVLVRIVAAGICRTDVHIIGRWDSTETPVVLGHEGAGVVEEVGKDVKEVIPGDHVVLSYQYCGNCPQCQSGQPWTCQYLFELNFGYRRLDGSNALESNGVRGHFFGQSSWATHSLATEQNIVKISPDLPLDILAPLGCGMQTGAGTVMNTLDVQKGESIAVFGTGSVGLAAVMAARIVGANPIIGVDVHGWRLEIARELGATHVINASHEDIASVISGITGGGVDYVLEITGDPAMLQLASDLLNPSGTVALFAGDRDPDSMPENKNFIGVTEGSSIPQIFIPKLIELYQAGLFPFDRIVKFYDFTEINRAIGDVRSGDTIKPVVRISES